MLVISFQLKTKKESSTDYADYLGGFLRGRGGMITVFWLRWKFPCFPPHPALSPRKGEGSREEGIEAGISFQLLVISFQSEKKKEGRSEERRVGKECRSRGPPDH